MVNAEHRSTVQETWQRLSEGECKDEHDHDSYSDQANHPPGCGEICVGCCLSERVAGMPTHDSGEAILLAKCRTMLVCMTLLGFTIIHSHMMNTGDRVLLASEPRVNDDTRHRLGQISLFVTDFDEFDRGARYTYALAPQCHRRREGNMTREQQQHRGFLPPPFHRLLILAAPQGVWTHGVVVQMWKPKSLHPILYAVVTAGLVGVLPWLHLPLVGGGIMLSCWMVVLAREMEFAEKTNLLLLDNHHHTLHHPILSVHEGVRIPLPVNSSTWAKEITELCPATSLHLDGLYLRIPLRAHRDFQLRITHTLHERWGWLASTLILTITCCFTVSWLYYWLWFEWCTRQCGCGETKVQ